MSAPLRDRKSCQCAQSLGDSCNDRGSTGSSPSAFASGNEDHVGTLEGCLNLALVLLSSSASYLWIRSGTESTGYVSSNVQLYVRVTHKQCLSVSVDSNKLHATKARLNHPVQSINPTAADANYFDYGLVVRDF
ncbi:MAG: hypothetical protein ABR68_01860 [Microbacteriaceae bacterium BACL28 MAG-120531-bin53]|nr:MAG: hypothetical protein ABR68_01860 [Microbacteriaceae bacterium BACL28 MAG-120531-bin53]